MSISLTKLGPAAADEAVANLSLELYKAYDILQNLFEKGCLFFTFASHPCFQLDTWFLYVECVNFIILAFVNMSLHNVNKLIGYPKILTST